MLTAGTSPLDIHAHLEYMMFVFVSKFGFKNGSSGKKNVYGANKWTLSSKSTQWWCNIQSLVLLVYIKYPHSAKNKAVFLCLFKWGQRLLSPRRLQWNATLQRLRSWLTWTYVTLLLQSFSTECLLKITITDTQGGYDKFPTEVIFSNLEVYSFLCVVTNNTDFMLSEGTIGLRRRGNQIAAFHCSLWWIMWLIWSFYGAGWRCFAYNLKSKWLPVGGKTGL